MQTNQNIAQNVQNIQPSMPSVQGMQAMRGAMQGAQNKPEKKFKAGAISISVWKNSAVKDGKTVEYKTVSVGKSYKKDGTWQNSNTSLRVQDLPKLAVIIHEAYKYLITNPQEQGGEEAIVM